MIALVLHILGSVTVFASARGVKSTLWYTFWVALGAVNIIVASFGIILMLRGGSSWL